MGFFFLLLFLFREDSDGEGTETGVHPGAGASLLAGAAQALPARAILIASMGFSFMRGDVLPSSKSY